MTIIATDNLFFTHAWETYLIGGLIIFLIGLLVGWFLWRHCRAQAEEVENINRTLHERETALTETNSKLSDLINELPEKPLA